MADTARPALAPLSANAAGGLKPLGVGLQPATPPAAERPAGVDVSVAANDPVESYLAEHPETPVAETPAPSTPEAPASETPATPAPETPPTEGVAPAVAAPTAEAPAAPSIETKPAAEAKPGEVPAAEVKPGEQPAAAAPTQPKPTYAADEKIVLAANPDGTTVEWTRGQITAALHERAQHAPLIAEAAAFKEVFGTDAATAKAEWSPILERLRSEPHTVALFEAALADPDKAAYLQRSLAHYDAEVAAGNYQPQPNVPPQTDPLVRQQLAATQAWIAQQEQRAASERIQREYNDAVGKYPFLATNKALFDGIKMTAAALNRQNPEWGLAEAVATNREMLDALLIAQQPTPVADTPQPTPPVPALLGSPGASPGATRGSDDGRPKKFPSLDDATDAWLRDHPS